MPSLARPLLLLAVVMLAPIVPFLLLGEQVDDWTAAWLARRPSPAVLASVALLLLWSDILLPVPSSLVSTALGAELGGFAATGVTFVGATLGAVTGFSLTRAFGRRLALRLTGPSDFRRMSRACRRHGAWLLLALRPLPVLAEASVLLVGVHRMAWRSFLPPVLLGNLLVAGCYAVLGETASRHDWLAAALVLSIAAPVLLTMAARAVWPRRSEQRPVTLE